MLSCPPMCNLGEGKTPLPYTVPNATKIHLNDTHRPLWRGNGLAGGGYVILKALGLERVQGSALVAEGIP